MAAASSSSRRWWRPLGAAVLIAAVWLWPLRAPATIAEQRARLPPPAVCDDDPVAGVWKSHKHNPQWGDWSSFILRIARVEGSETELTGTLHNHNWSGGPRDEEPPPCGPGRHHWIVSTDARGVVEGNRIQFWGVGQWRLDRVVCSRGPGGYNLDNFSGTIDFDLMEFQSVNNDGGRAVNYPTVFRRIACLPPPDGAQAPSVETVPPPFYPHVDTGCSAAGAPGHR